MSDSQVVAIRDVRKTQLWWPITPDNCTVLGYPVTQVSKLWTQLVWDERVHKDRGPHVLSPTPGEYLHVPVLDPLDPLDDGDRRYRVRCVVEVGGRLERGGLVLEVTEVRVERMQETDLAIPWAWALTFRRIGPEGGAA